MEKIYGLRRDSQLEGNKRKTERERPTKKEESCGGRTRDAALKAALKGEAEEKDRVSEYAGQAHVKTRVKIREEKKTARGEGDLQLVGEAVQKKRHQSGSGGQTSPGNGAWAR